MHHYVHHPLIQKQIMPTYQCVNTSTRGEMVRSEQIKHSNFFSKMNIYRANKQTHLLF